MDVSVIICSHNPRKDYLGKALAALQRQTLSCESWELLLIDNASDVSLDGLFDLSWHPHASHIREKELGLTHARLCGIQHAKGDLFVFVDDDNVLDISYLESALRIAETRKYIGAFGGSCIGEFESEPPGWIGEYMGYLAVRTVERESWGNQKDWSMLPIGAGLIVRRSISETYREAVLENDLKVSLDRVGSSLISCGDEDLVYTAIDEGYGIGLFPELKLNHLISSARLTEEYICRLLRGITRSKYILQSIRGDETSGNQSRGSIRKYFGYLRRRVLWSRRRRRFFEAFLEGKDDARTELKTL